MARQVTTNTDVDVFVDNVRQEPVTAYAVANKTLTFTEAPPSGTGNIYIIYRNSYGNQNFANLPDGAITFAKLANNIKQFTVETFTGDGSTTAFVCTETPANANSLIVSIDGVIQNATTNFALATKTITFTSAPANAAAIVVKFLGFRTDVAVSALSAGIVTTAALADNSVTAAKIAPGTIVDSDIADNAVTTAKILNANVTTAKIADVNVTTGKLAANAVTTAKITDANVTTAKIADDAVTVAKVNLISTGSVPSLEAKGTSGVTSGYIKLNCSENSHGIKLLGPPHSAGANYTLTLPNNDGDANQYLQTNGSGVTSWASVSSTPSSLQTSRTVTGSVTARRAVSIAPDASIGAYPTVNTLSSQIQSDAASDILVFVDGRSGQTSARMTQATSGSTHTVSIYGQYMNGARKWVENGTPLTIGLSLDGGTAINPKFNTYPRGISTQANTFLIYQGCSGGSTGGTEACAQVTAVIVNPSTGVPTIEGSSQRRTIIAGSGIGGSNNVDFGEIADGRYKTALYTSGLFRVGVQWRYTPGSGFSMQDVGTAAYLAKLTTNYQYYNVANPPGYTQLSADGTKMYFTVVDHSQVFNRYAISSNFVTDAVKVAITVPCSDYLADGKTQFLDSTHFIFYYKNSGGRYAVKTFSISGDTPTLIDTEVAPAGFTKAWNICPKLSDTKKIVVSSFNNPGALGNDKIFTIELASDYTITGFSPLQTIAIDVGENMQPRNLSGNIFNLAQVTGGKSTNQTYTVNAYSTTQFTYGGIATASASSGTTPLLISGLSSGHSSLSVGSDYFVRATLDGQITADPTLATSTRVGKAISTTEIIVGDVT